MGSHFIFPTSAAMKFTRTCRSSTVCDTAAMSRAFALTTPSLSPSRLAPPEPASNRWADIRSLDCFQGFLPQSRPPAVCNDRLGSNLQTGKTAHSTCLLRNTFQRHWLSFLVFFLCVILHDACANHPFLNSTVALERALMMTDRKPRAACGSARLPWSQPRCLSAPPHVRAEPNDVEANVRDVHFEITHRALSTSERHIRKSLCSAELSSTTFFVLFLLHVDWVHCSSHLKKQAAFNEFHHVADRSFEQLEQKVVWTNTSSTRTWKIQRVETFADRRETST